MARMPGAIWKPLAANWNKQPRMRAYDFFCVHTMVGTLAGTQTYFEKSNGPGYDGTESHFGIGGDGTIWQFQDTDFQADANYSGGWHVISSENADTGAPFPKWAGSDVPALTPEQVEANAEIAVWLNRTHGIPLGVTRDSKPGSRGLAPHRWGVPGYMVAGAEQWSTARFKACPGDRRIAQLPAISARAQQLLGGASIQEDDMTPDELFAAALFTDNPGTPQARTIRVRDFFNELRAAAQKASTPQPAQAAQVNVNAADVAAALAANQEFAAALAKAVNDDAARRLAS